MPARRPVQVQVDVSKAYGRFPVLNGVRFSVYENEFLCIVGPSGCGKTTLANLIAGLTPATAGQVLIGGEPVHPRRHRIAYVFQERACLPWRTVWDNVKIGLEAKGQCGPGTERQIQEVIDLVGLSGFERYYPHQISGGMKQRVAIARAFCTESDLLLMDEPFGSLDAQTRYLMQIEVLRIWQKLRRTVIFITNNIEEAVYLAERVIIFSQVPATVTAEVPIDLPRPRELTDLDFLDVRRRVTELADLAEAG